jgi:hypothetical protein
MAVGSRRFYLSQYYGALIWKMDIAKLLNCSRFFQPGLDFPSCSPAKQDKQV